MARARQLVAGALRAWGLEDEVPAVELAVSELVANAIRHATGPFALHVDAETDLVRLEVHVPRPDEGPVAAPEAPEPPDDWYVWFVEQVADDWGTQEGPDHTVTWVVRKTGHDNRRPLPRG